MFALVINNNDKLQIVESEFVYDDNYVSCNREKIACSILIRNGKLHFSAHYFLLLFIIIPSIINNYFLLQITGPF